MKDDVIRGATATHKGKITFPPPPPKIQAIAAKGAICARTNSRRNCSKRSRCHEEGRVSANNVIGSWWCVDVVDGGLCAASFMQHFIVFALACFVGFPSDLECKPRIAHTVDGDHQCDFWDYHSGCRFYRLAGVGSL